MTSDFNKFLCFVGSCILQYWNFSAALQPCKCPMCSQRITRLIPEASLYHRHQAEITKVLRSVRDYNRLFVGGISGFMLVGAFVYRMGYENICSKVVMAFSSYFCLIYW